MQFVKHCLFIKTLYMKITCTRLVVVLMALSLFITPAAAVTVPDVSTTTTTPDAASVEKAMAEFRSLSKREKKLRMKEVKKALKDYKVAKKAGKAEPSTNTLLLVILAILLPPLAVYLHEGEVNNRFWLSLILTLLFWVPGVIYALIVVLS